MMDKIKDVVNSWWFNVAATGVLAAALLVYGMKLYAGIAAGWALSRFWTYLRS